MPGPSVGLGCQPPPQMITSLEEDEEMRQLILQDAAPSTNAIKEDCDNGNANNKPDWHSGPSQQSWSAPLPSGIHSAYRNTSIASSASTTTTTSTTSSSSTDNAASSSRSSSTASSPRSSRSGLGGQL